MREDENKPLCVTLEEPVIVPGDGHEPASTSVFRARERCIGDTRTEFLGVNIGPGSTILEVKNENIRAVAKLDMHKPNIDMGETLHDG